MWELRLPALDSNQVNAILAPCKDARYSWQNEAVDTIHKARQRASTPMLIFNVASTGAGKTIMNMKAGCAASPAPPRLSYALNLRTLTLQTGKALTRELQLDRESVATVIGDQLAARLHEAEQTAADPQEPSAEDDDRFDDIRYEAIGGREDMPDWLSPVTERRPEWRRILATPILASTVDFLVQAGEPGRQGHHAAAYLRLMHSDLVLDEVDSYDTESLVAVLRLIQTAASLGRNVICSSATLPGPIASAIAEAYGSGQRIWASLCRRAPAHGVLLISDTLTPRWVRPAQGFEIDYMAYLSDLGAKRVPLTKRPYLQPVGRLKGMDGLLSAIGEGIERLHAAHQWPLGGSGKRVSLGLVRVGNIQTAIEVASFLQRRPDTYVCLYHARDFLIQRYLKERSLDRLLSRKEGNLAIEQDASVQAICAGTQAASVRFVVVATPVEEVGRDHDFDWSVIEPSSSHSIVQTAGRVNRHRRVEVDQANVAVLQYNARALRGEDTIFARPGPEGSVSFRRKVTGYPDLGQMLDWQKLEQLTSQMVSDTAHPLVVGESLLQKALLQKPLKILRRDEGYGNIWMTSAFYGKYPLRGGQQHGLEDWRVIPREGGGSPCWERLEKNGYKFEYQEKPAPKTDMPQTNWLSWRAEELFEACEEVGISPAQGMTIKIRRARHM